MKSFHFATIVALSVSALFAAPGAMAQGAERFTISADASEVTDNQSKLIWSRCLLGMRMQAGRCQGSAQALAASLIPLRLEELNKETGKKWRLPSMAELRQLVSMKDADYEKIGAIDSKAFPGTPASRVWTTQSTGAHYQHWVSFMDGSTGESPRSTSIAVRLVREP
jgi:hypothetical protein